MPISKRTTTIKSNIKPYWVSNCGRATIYVGDCRDILPNLEENKFHAVVTDPPYELNFMTKKWDATGVAFDIKTWGHVIRVCKPGAHLLAFSGSRTYHRMTCAIEDANFEIRDCIMWVYGTGYPKSLDVSKAIDKKLGAERSKIKTPMPPSGNVMMNKIGSKRPWKEKAKELGYHEHDSNEPVTEEAKKWQGWGTTLKPAYEPIVLARKGIENTIAECVMNNSTGALNIDDCRVNSNGEYVINILKPHKSSGSNVYRFNSSENGTVCPSMSGGIKRVKDGKWPANFIHDGSAEILDLLPENAHRFFYVPKADDEDRPHSNTDIEVIHPTVKPLDLMRYLVKLVSIKNGEILDPFCGTGSTGCAALSEDMNFTGIELSKEYADIAIGKLRLIMNSSSRPKVKKIVR